MHQLPSNPNITVNQTKGTVTLSCAVMTCGSNGARKADENGCYRVVLGGFNVHNRSGDFYPMDERVKKIFQPGSALMRRVANKALKGEYQHPVNNGGMSKAAWIKRVCTIDELKVSHQILKIEVDFTSFTNDQGQPVMTIIGYIKPCGPYGEALRKSLENETENVAFSIRSLSINKPIAGVLNRFVTDAVTWDHVNEGGISIANQDSTPSMETLSEDVVTERSLDTITNADGDEYSFESAAVPLMTLRSALQEIKVTDLNRSSFFW